MGGKVKAGVKRGPSEWASAGGQKRSCGPRVELRSVDLLQLASPGGPERWNNNKAKTFLDTFTCVCVGVSVRACVGARARMHTICACVCMCVCNASLPSAIAWLACSRCCRLLLRKYRSRVRDTARQGAELAELLAQYCVLVFEGAASASAGRKLRYRVGCVIIHAGFHQACHVTRHDEQPSLVLKSNRLTVRALVRHVCE
jgi:hypothetical protein